MHWFGYMLCFLVPPYNALFSLSFSQSALSPTRLTPGSWWHSSTFGEFLDTVLVRTATLCHANSKSLIGYSYHELINIHLPRWIANSVSLDLFILKSATILAYKAKQVFFFHQRLQCILFCVCVCLCFYALIVVLKDYNIFYPFFFLCSFSYFLS